MQAKPEVVPEALRLTGLRNVQVDKNGINRATSNLHAWGIPQKEIDGMLEEAEKIPKRGGKHDPAKDAQLGRVEIRSPADGVVIERNVAANEVIPDNTINLFQLANLEKLLVIGNFPEDKVIGGESPTWTVETARGPLPCVITDTGIHVEPNQRTTFIKGIVDNKRGLLQAGQFVNLVLHIPTPRNVVEIPTICVETIEGGPPVVFVQKDPAIANYTMQPVAIVQKVGETTFVRSENANRIGVDKPRAAESVPPTQPLLPGTRLLQSGVEELVGILQDRERKARGESK
jgi:cobalt-zinc-cadmium efflux system membrane fusion protein